MCKPEIANKCAKPAWAKPSISSRSSAVFSPNTRAFSNCLVGGVKIERSRAAIARAFDWRKMLVDGFAIGVGSVVLFNW